MNNMPPSEIPYRGIFTDQQESALLSSGVKPLNTDAENTAINDSRAVRMLIKNRQRYLGILSGQGLAVPVPSQQFTNELLCERFCPEEPASNRNA